MADHDSDQERPRRGGARRALNEVAGRAREVAEEAVIVALGAAGAAAAVATGTASEARAIWRQREAARRRRLRRLNRVPLPNLYTVHPEYEQATPYDLGLRPIPVDEIAGTAVQGPDQRGSDFLPLPPFRSADWAARWQRIRTAVDRLRVLPPIEVVQAAGAYWLLDGHNRVGAALYAGQTEIDALIRALRLPGEAHVGTRGSLAPLVEEAALLRAAVRAGGERRHVAPAGEAPAGEAPAGEAPAGEATDGHAPAGDAAEGDAAARPTDPT
jgi:hypothetical protein